MASARMRQWRADLLASSLHRAAAVERDPDRRNGLRRHADPAADAALNGTADQAARASIASRHAGTLPALARDTGAGDARA